MDAERAETYLRLKAETELRRTAIAGDGAGLFRGEVSPRSPLIPSGLMSATTRLRNVAQALTTIGAIDHLVADAILANFELAVAVRQPAQERSPISARPAMRRRVARLMQAVSPQTWPAPNPGALLPGPAAPAAQPGPDRVIPVGMMVPFRDDEVRGELYLMAFSQTPNGARFSVHAWLRDALSDMPPHGAIHLLRDFTATDDQGAGYTLGFVGHGTMAGWNGLLRLDHAPPPGVRWLDLACPGGPTRRVSLEPPLHHPAVTITEITRSPGEHLLNATAVRLLTAAVEVAARSWPGPPATALRQMSQLATGLGDIVEALVAARALSPLSPVPGQLAMLCESLDLREHGITAVLNLPGPPAAALPASELPTPWLSMLSYAHRRKPEIASPRDGCADVALALPELDGITISILGLHANEEGTDLHIYLTGIPPDVNPETHLLPTLWLRDDTGRWHAARGKGMNVVHDGEAAAQLQILPPLTRCTSLDIIAAGRSAEARGSVPVRWR
ncbi:MAG TPA: hypothetical protein VF070_00435 [Streptosporangiaceae bacterium]